MNSFGGKDSICPYVTEFFDKNYDGFWSCVIGDFAATVTYKEKHYISFLLKRDMQILIYRAY